jgi:ribosome-binding factor A
MAKQRRVHRVAEKVRETVALEVQRLADPRFSMVTITSVVSSADLRNVKIYWMVSGGEERRAEVQDAFESAGGVFKRIVGRDLGIKFVPEIRFFYDDTLDASEEVQRLIDRIHQNDDQAGDPQQASADDSDK